MDSSTIYSELFSIFRNILLTAAVLVLFSLTATAQVDEICAEAGITPSFDSPFAQVPYLYGKITLRGYESNAKPPNVTITLVDGQQNPNRWTVGKSGNYCFRLRVGSNGTLIVEVDGIEATRRSLPSLGAAQQREDFEIHSPNSKPAAAAPGVISAKFSHPPNPKTTELYKKLTAEEASKDTAKLIGLLKEIVAADPADFLAWTRLGILHFEKKAIPEADAAFRKALELKVEYTPAWVNAAMVRMNQKQFEAAVEILKHAATLEPKSARIYQLMGESYLLSKQGSLGAEALNKAIELDPIGMAELHLQLAHLYQLAKANKLAAAEYKIFLEKVPEYKERKKLEDFIKSNS